LTGGFVFIWETPFGQQITTEPALVLGSTSLNSEGLYTVQVLKGDCLSNVSAPIFLDILPKPLPPTVTVNSPVCEGDTLYFTTTVQPGIVVDNWQWQGPVDFANAAGNSGNPIRTPVLLSHAGPYFVRITVNGCTSELAEPIIVSVKPRPQTPIALFDGNVCLDQADTLTLQVAPATQTNLASYQWFLFNTQAALDTASLSPVYQYTQYAQLSPGQNGFYVQAILDGCRSIPSFPVSVVFDTIPNINAAAMSDYTACDQINTLSLVANQPSAGSGAWSQLSGPAINIADPNNLFTEASPIFANNIYRFLWTLSNGACKNFSRDTVNVTVVTYEPAVAMPDMDTCFANSVLLQATPGPNFAGFWSQPASQSQIQPPIVITNPGSAVTSVTGLTAGASNFYYFIWTVSSSACGTSTDTVVVRVIGTVPNAGTNRSICTDDDCVPLQASPLLPSETGKWTSTNPEVIFVSPGSPATDACGLTPGPNLFVWETNGGICSNASRDTVVLTYEQTPVAFNDTVQVPFGAPVNFNVLNNDLIPAAYALNVTAAPVTGLLTNLGAGAFTYLPDVTFAGKEQMIYTVCNLNCTDTTFANRCDVGNVLLEVSNALECDIPSVITPNGDQVNDVFFIPCLSCADCLQDNELTIFNQWGDHVFHAKPYLQNWTGTYNGEDLPAGSYFYVLKYVVGNNVQTRTGFIIVQR
jgi:gliding motility-associated-like protein